MFEAGQKAWCSMAWDYGDLEPVFREVELLSKSAEGWFYIYSDRSTFDTHISQLFPTKDAMIDEKIRLLRQDIDRLEKYRTSEILESNKGYNMNAFNESEKLEKPNDQGKWVAASSPQLQQENSAAPLDRLVGQGQEKNQQESIPSKTGIEKLRKILESNIGSDVIKLIWGKGLDTNEDLSKTQ